MRSFRRTWFASIAMLITGVASGAPFCVVTAAGKRCYYYDKPSCERAAESARGACVGNVADERPPVGSAPFCVVSAAGTRCFYYDLQPCEDAARAARGTCAAR